MNWGKGQRDGQGVALLGVEGRVLKSCTCCREKRRAWGLNQRSIAENWWDFTERGGGVGNAVLFTSGLWE